MNQCELIFLALAASGLLIYLRWEFKSWKAGLLLALLCLLPLYLSLERTSQFLTTDETYIIAETLYLKSSDLQQWMLGGFRTSETLFGLLAAIISRFLPQTTVVQAKTVLKCFHWIFGFGVILWIHQLLRRYFIARSNRGLFFLSYFYTALLLPTNNLALKVFNYDLLSMLLGIVAILYLITAIRLKNTKHALLAVVVSYLATQEKLIASPILILSVAVYGYIACSNYERARHLNSIKSIVVGTATAMFTGFLFVVIVAGLRDWHIPKRLLWSVIYPFVSWTWPVIQFVFGLTDFRNLYDSLLVLALAIITMILVSRTLLQVDRLTKKHPNVSQEAALQISRLNRLLFIGVFILGLVGTFYVEAYWAPHFPIASGHYQPSAELNRNILHFNEPSYWQHLLSFFAYSSAVFVNAIPSIYWLLFAALWISARHHTQDVKSDLSIELPLTVSLLLPLLFALFQIQVVNRYLNISIFLLTLIISLKTTEFISTISKVKQAAVFGMFAVLLLLEIMPFRPLYGAFRPIWANYTDSNTVVVGKLNPSWLGWGEELMLAGEMLEKQYHNSDKSSGGDQAEPQNLYTVYPGEWLNTKTNIKTIQLPIPLEIGKPSAQTLIPSSANLSMYANSDYYVINRSSVVQGYCELPAGVEPAFVISFRGFIQAWVFRGDQIKAAGYRFNLRRR